MYPTLIALAVTPGLPPLCAPTEPAVASAVVVAARTAIITTTRRRFGRVMRFLIAPSFCMCPSPEGRRVGQVIERLIQTTVRSLVRDLGTPCQSREVTPMEAPY